MFLRSYLLLFFAVFAAVSAPAQNDWENAPRMFEREKLLASPPKNLPFPDKDKENPWAQIDHADVEQCSGTWVASWLNLQAQNGSISNKKRDCKIETSENSGEEQERCKVSFDWVSAKNKNVQVKYTGNWRSCNSDETYHFAGVSVQEVYVFLLQEEDWLAEIRRPKNLKPNKVYDQALLANEEHPTYIFTVVFDKKNQILSLSAVYGSEGFSYSYVLKAGKEKNSCTLTIKNECVL